MTPGRLGQSTGRCFVRGVPARQIGNNGERYYRFVIASVAERETARPS